MTRLNLTESCLLDASGELGAKARAQLHEKVATIPAAKLEYEVIKGQFALLRSLPRPQLTDEEKRHIASNIKQGIHRKLRERQHELQARNRWKLIYQAMAGVSALAACLVVAASVYFVQSGEEARRQQARSEDLDIRIGNLLSLGEKNADDRTLANVKSNIQELENGSPTLVSVESPEMKNLIETLSNVPAQEESPSKPGPF